MLVTRITCRWRPRAGQPCPLSWLPCSLQGNQLLLTAGVLSSDSPRPCETRSTRRVRESYKCKQEVLQPQKAGRADHLDFQLHRARS